MCHEHWAFQELCPDCWSELTEMMEAQDWKCSVCGGPVDRIGITTPNGQLILMMSCSNCKVVYRPA